MQSDRDLVESGIASLDLEPIKFKLVKEHGYAEKDVGILEKWYKRFLLLTFIHKERPIVVSEAIDAFWHQHILDTRKYAQDCETAFGDFLHHFPYFGLRGDDDQKALRSAYRATLDLMRDEFGETPEEDLKIFGNPEIPAPELPSLCSDCSSVWPNSIVPYGQERPRLPGSPPIR
jgi:hypothetical protein